MKVSYLHISLLRPSRIGLLREAGLSVLLQIFTCPTVSHTFGIFRTSITENSSNYKQIYEICNHLLGRTKDSPMPPGVTNKDLAYRFNNFFIDKITKIHNDLIGKQQHPPLYVETPALKFK